MRVYLLMETPEEYMHSSIYGVYSTYEKALEKIKELYYKEVEKIKELYDKDIRDEFTLEDYQEDMFAIIPFEVQ